MDGWRFMNWNNVRTLELWMNDWTEGRMDGWMDWKREGRMDGWRNGSMDWYTAFHLFTWNFLLYIRHMAIVYASLVIVQSHAQMARPSPVIVTAIARTKSYSLYFPRLFCSFDFQRQFLEEQWFWGKKETACNTVVNSQSILLSISKIFIANSLQKCGTISLYTNFKFINCPWKIFWKNVIQICMYCENE